VHPSGRADRRTKDNQLPEITKVEGALIDFGTIDFVSTFASEHLA
jgi:hypothetical protein